ncbi:HAAS signaling domain-containing protein [Lysinibacillus xylanilyticus]|uniref:HAAS signaling domain-containing protein n=1 Tax=Lysinibacillus xylanilyticus TaxID=582475 RepID=UPI003D025E00
MNLTEIYIQEVTRRLPEKNRKDIALELRSTIMDMLPDDYSEDDVKDVLEKLGNPAALASGYRDKPMHLIGPRYFDVYISLLKMIIPIAVVIALISMAAEYFIGFGGEEVVINAVLTILGEGIWRVIEVGIHVFFWLTLVFVIIERKDKGKDQHPLSASLQKWTPEDLKNIIYIPKKKAITKLEVFGYLMWTAIWATLYFYSNHLLGIYEGGGDGLEFVIPALNQDVLLRYWPIIIVVIALEIGLALYKLLKGQWTKKMASFNTILELFATVVFIIILSNPNLINQEFITYMSKLFSTTTKQFEIWIVGGGIIIFILSAAISIFDAFRKARIR